MRNQTYFDRDNPLFRAEKDIFIESDMHRARLFLYDNDNLIEAQEQEIEKWLTARLGI